MAQSPVLWISWTGNHQRSRVLNVVKEANTHVLKIHEVISMLQLHIPKISGEVQVMMGNVKGLFGSNDMMVSMWISPQKTSVTPDQISACNNGRFEFGEQKIQIDKPMSHGPQSLFIKITSSGGIPEGDAIKEYARPQITQVMVEKDLESVCQHGQIFSLESHSIENDNLRYIVTIKTSFAQVFQATTSIDLHSRYTNKSTVKAMHDSRQQTFVSDAQRAILAELMQWHIPTSDISSELAQLSKNRQSVISTHIQALTSGEYAQSFDQNWITIPTFNHLMIRELDVCQLHHATEQVGIANQTKHVLNLIVAAQQTLVDINFECHDNAIITPASAATAVHYFKRTPESKKRLRNVFVRNLTKYVNVKTSYTFDTRVDGLYMTPPPTNTNTKVSSQGTSSKNTVLFSPVVNEQHGDGEDYSLAGLTTAATHHMRSAVMPNVAHAIHEDTSMDWQTKNAMLASCRAMCFVGSRTDDCEGSCCAIVGACSALRNGDISTLNQAVQLIFDSRILQHDAEFHSAIRDVLFTVRAELQDTSDRIHTSLVMARGPQANTTNAPCANSTQKQAPTLSSVMNDLQENMKSYAGHAVATTVTTQPLTQENDAEGCAHVVAITSHTPMEGTVETFLTDNQNLCTVNVKSTDPKINSHLQNINNTVVPEYNADNIIRQVLSDATQHCTGISHTPTHVCNIKTDDSFYAYFMASGEHVIFMHDQPFKTFQNHLRQRAPARISDYPNQCMKASRTPDIVMSPYASMVLASRYEHIDVANHNRPPVSVPYGITVPPSKRESMLICAMARAMAPSYPDLPTQIASAEATLFALPYTASILNNNFRARDDMTKINCVQPVSANFNMESQARAQHQEKSNAVARREIDSHCFSLYFQ
jgi:hypothetical protein